MSFDRSRYMKNWWKARVCHGCKGLSIGRSVDHNHCNFSDAVWARDRVNGRIDICLGRKYLDMECHLNRKKVN